LSGADAGRGLNKGFPVRGSSEFSTFTASALITIGKGWGGSSWTSYYECSQSSASCFLSVLRSRQPTPRAGSTRLRQCIRTNCRFSRSICCDLSTFRIRAAMTWPGFRSAVIAESAALARARRSVPVVVSAAGYRPAAGRARPTWYAYATLTQTSLTHMWLGALRGVQVHWPAEIYSFSSAAIDGCLLGRTTQS